MNKYYRIAWQKNIYKFYIRWYVTNVNNHETKCPAEKQQSSYEKKKAYLVDVTT